MEQLSDESLRFASVRAAAGEGSQLEVRLLEVEKNRIAAERPLLTGNAETAFEELGALVGTPPRNLTLKDRDAVLFDTPELASLIATALRNHPELGVARAAVAKAEAEIKLAKAQAIQDVTGFVQFGKARSQNAQFGLDGAGRRAQVRDNDNVLGAGLSMSLPFRNRNQGNIAAAEAELRAAQFRASSVSLQLEREVRTAFLRYRAASAAIRGLSENVLANARSNLETIRKAYELGELRILDVLQEQRRLVELDRTANEVRSLESKALLDLEQATGLSIVTTTGGAR
jgi:cobalt-zinc-cadmium efflux system outer membrane protein